MNSFKQNIVEACFIHLSEKIKSLNGIITEVNAAGNSETKSSAGDKHETARAMMQLEQEKLGNQLKEAEIQLVEFKKNDFTKIFQRIEQGSLVETNKGYFFIASSVGKIVVDEKIVFVISHRSPLAIAMIGKQENDKASFNGVEYIIDNIF